MLSLNVYSEFSPNLKLNQWEQIFDEDQKWRLYRIFYVAYFCVLIKTASIEVLGKCFHITVGRTKLVLENVQLALLATYHCKSSELVSF